MSTEDLISHAAEGETAFVDKLRALSVVREAPAAAWATRRASGTSVVAVAKVQHRAAALQPASYDPAARTIDVVFTTGAAVARSSYAEGDYTEVLSIGPSNVRLDRLNAGAPLLDSHQAGSLGTVLGSVVPGSARMEAGQGVATVRLSDAARAADTVADIRDGVIRSVSVGYLIHAFSRTTGVDGGPVLTVTDWEPVEISAVAVPADAGAQFRSMPSAAAPVQPRSASGEVEWFRRAVSSVGSAEAPPPATTRRWAEAMRASGTLGTTEAGRALARRLNLTTETR